MAKKKRPNESNYDKRHNITIEKYVRRIRRIYTTAATQATLAATRVQTPKPDKIFAFSDYPSLKKEVEEIFKTMHDAILASIVSGTREAWYLSQIKNDELTKYVLNDKALQKEITQKYFSRNQEALSAFQKRKIGGLGLSDRVWKMTDGYQTEIELALDNGIGSGRSAASLSRDVRKYLNEPDKLFRRVRDKHGELKLSKAAEAYHPGQGVYRSSFKNAMRLTRTEISLSYQEADYQRIKAFPFVVGIRVNRSNNPYPCIVCDSIKGDYPPTFKWVLNHANCRCFTTTILATEQEIMDFNTAILKGDNPTIKSVNAVTKVPDSFTKFINDNKKRIANYKSQPFYVKNNFVDGDVLKGLKPL